LTSINAHPRLLLQIQIGRKLKEFLDIPESTKIGYGVFSEKLASNKAKDKYSC
jgi:hypothetical protein